MNPYNTACVFRSIFLLLNWVIYPKINKWNGMGPKYLFGCPKRKENEKTKPKWPCLGVL